MAYTVDETIEAPHRRPVPKQIPGVFGGRVVVYGFALKESTGLAAAEVDLLNSSPQGGGFDAIPVTLKAGESRCDWFGPRGLEFDQGLNASLVSGAVVGSVFIVEEESR